MIQYYFWTFLENSVLNKTGEILQSGFLIFNVIEVQGLEWDYTYLGDRIFHSEFNHVSALIGEKD